MAARKAREKFSQRETSRPDTAGAESARRGSWHRPRGSHRPGHWQDASTRSEETPVRLNLS
jgi:hypothetical protein